MLGHMIKVHDFKSSLGQIATPPYQSIALPVEASAANSTDRGTDEMSDAEVMQEMSAIIARKREELAQVDEQLAWARMSLGSWRAYSLHPYIPSLS